MEIREFDLILLRDGREGAVVDVTAPGIVYEVDVGDSPANWETITVYQDQIEKVLKHYD